MSLEDLLRRMLEQLAVIGEEHEELYDSETRERMGDAVHYGFLLARGVEATPTDLGMLTDDANRAIRAVIVEYVRDANAVAEPLNMSFHDRLNAFQNNDVVVGKERQHYSDFFGWCPPECFDANGNVIRTDI